MKIMKKILIAISTALLLTGCNNKPVDNPKNEEEKFEVLTTDPIYEGSYGGNLIELRAGRFLEVNREYACSFTLSTNLNKTFTARSYYEEVATIEISESSTGFTICTHKVGDTIIYLYDINGVLVLRELVQVRKTLSTEEMATRLFETDLWKSTGGYGKYDMYFTSDSPLSGTLTGKDDFENTTLVFTLSDPTVETIYDFTFYKYEITLDKNESKTSRTYHGLYVAVTGDEILIYYSSGTEISLFEMFHPVTIK